MRYTHQFMCQLIMREARKTA